jgi:photosystem II stability/assembly factor-like uncharacterized protein
MEWEQLSEGSFNVETVLVPADDPGVIYFGSPDGVFKSEDAGKSWKNILLLSGGNKKVNFLLLDPDNKNTLFAATGNGLYQVSSANGKVKKIFKGKNAFEEECTTLAVSNQRIYLGTKAGLFISHDRGRSWIKAAGNLASSHILTICCPLETPDEIYVASVEGVFKSKSSGVSWEKIFVAHSSEGPELTQEIDHDQDEAERFSQVRYLGLDTYNLSQLYLATSRGIYKSQDEGKTWHALSSPGLLSRDCTFLLLSPQSSLYVASKSGVFILQDGHWQELSVRLLAGAINCLAQDNSNHLYVAAAKGLFRADIDNLSLDKGETLPKGYGQDGPTIADLQQAAIEYAEVNPEKIRQWRQQASKKAMLPKISLGFDREVGDLWHWETGSTTKVDDDTLRRGRDAVTWDVSLTWDLSELIWNSDQTSIDVRSKLMVELRDSILDEVTKIYFERLRVKMEIEGLSLEEKAKRAEKQLRLQELSACLDALTGGYFSRALD